MLEVQDAGLARLAELQLALAEKLYRLADPARTPLKPPSSPPPSNPPAARSA